MFDEQAAMDQSMKSNNFDGTSGSIDKVLVDNHYQIEQDPDPEDDDYSEDQQQMTQQEETPMASPDKNALNMIHQEM
tara:strand:+ start:106 stop:336 length:231 start_codon:yes stop_codon:yes gene_type:complete